MDQTLFRLINERWTNPVLDLFMAVMSNVEIWKPLLMVIALSALVFGGFKGRAFVVCVLISLLLAENVTRFMKTAVNRHRPKQVQVVRMVELQKASPEFLTIFKRPTIRHSDESDWHRSGPSFPSGHTTNNTVIAVCCTIFFRRRGWLYWLITATVSYSRIYLGAHWPSDVAATLLLAAGETLLVLALAELLWNWIGRRWVPNSYRRNPSLVLDYGRPAADNGADS